VANIATVIRFSVGESVTIDMAMESIVHVEKRESIPDDAAVFHYDELNEGFKERFPRLTEDTPAKGSVGPESVLSDGDYVKFTDYYQVTCQ
jgi:hypothetical protein